MSVFLKIYFFEKTKICKKWKNHKIAVFGIIREKKPMFFLQSTYCILLKEESIIYYVCIPYNPFN